MVRALLFVVLSSVKACRFLASVRIHRNVKFLFQNTLLRRVIPKVQSTAVVGKGREETLHKPEVSGCLANSNKNP